MPSGTGARAVTTLGVGPFCNESGDWWVPVDAEPNRMRAAHIVRQCMDDSSSVVYVGREMANLTPHETGCDCGDDCERPVMAWHFEEREP